jgi:hypothetical protein
MDRRRFLRRLSGAAAAGFAVPGIASALPAFRYLNPDGDDEPKTFVGVDVFNRLMEQARAEGWAGLPVGDIVGKVAMALRGTPYVGSTLELSDDRELCSVNLKGLDCVTLFENALDFARVLKKGGRTPEDLINEVTFTRYRGGKIGDYTSRLHYTTDWIHDNVDKGVVVDITPELPGAIVFDRVVDFMSTHPGSYRQLKAHPELVPVIARFERTINSRTMHYVPKARIADAEPMLKTGDIVGITTTIKGIDISHTGLCYRDDSGSLRFLHASLTHKEVMLDARLSEYVSSVSKDTGIMVVRPLWRDA